MKPERFVIVGFGAMGQWLYHRLRQHNIDVAVKKSDSEHPLPSTIRVIEHSNSFAHLVRVVNTFSDNDHIFVCVKSYDVESVIKSLKNQQTILKSIVFFQNGLSHLDIAERHLPKTTCFAGLSTLGVARESGALYLNGYGELLLGQLHGNGNKEQKASLLSALSCAFARVSWQRNMHRAIWRKLAVNVAVNPLTAYYRCNNGALLTIYSEPFEQILGEIDDIFKHLPSRYNIPPVRDFILETTQKTASNTSSMLQDIQNAKPIELESILGHFLIFAKSKSKATPRLTKLYNYLLKHTA